MKRGTDHTWVINRYKGDLMLYAHCRCGFEYGCSQSRRNQDGTWSFEQEIHNLFNYCPSCGARKKWMTETNRVDRIRWG